MFFKSMSSDGTKITASDIKRALQELKIRDEVASAEEFIERTAGVA